MSDETPVQETVEVPVSGKPRMHEDAARFIRQRLLAIEEGRDEDAATLKQFILDEFGVNIRDIAVASVPEHLQERWRSIFGLPESVTHVTVLTDYANEPVWRIPADLETRAPSWMETPIHLQPTNPLAPADDPELQPEHHRPRQAGPLPEEIQAAIRPYVPEA